MKRYYNETTKEWYTEGQSLTRKIDGGVFCGIPSEELLLSWGFALWVEPVPTPEELLVEAKSKKMAEIEAYDNSEAVNSFELNGKTMWLDSQTRQQLRTSIESYNAIGMKNVTKWFNNQKYTYPTDVWITMLNNLEVYAAEALNVTEAHRALVSNMTRIEDVEAYDVTQGYPEKPIF